jgi:uncharacterized protein (TIGR00255 family)
MIRSMTGFGQSGRTACGYRMQVEVKSVNHRYAETTVRMPREWLAFEDALKKSIAKEVKRGRVDVFINIEREGESGKRVELDWDLALGYLEASRQLKDRLELQEELQLRDLLQIPGIVRLLDSHAQDKEEPGAELIACVEEAVAQLSVMRDAEGAHLLEDLDKRLQTLEEYHAAARSVAPRVVEEYRQKLEVRLQELLDKIPLDENRLAMEVAVFADRANIDEELTRLESHFSQFGKLLRSEEQSGRKLDFLIQEMNREVNTIGSKANQQELSAIVVEMKAELEKIREQVQNIE